MTQAADDTRQRLLEAAGEVFAAKGYQAATVRDICGRADANLAAVNYHFGDKERLYVEAVRQAHSSGHDEPSPNWKSQTPPQAKLGDFVRRLLTRLLDPLRPAWHAKLMAREMIEPSAACIDVLEP
ncbi:MAG TPA: CerR family C-terminal domain-containing protein, partial [Thermoguttaceae bacterium]|nr:CerR family C-terminal domain-containing protein [Thermoguttaceae bacterium]